MNRTPDRSKNDKSFDDELMFLSNRIEASCIISKKSNHVPTKSPLKLCFGNDNETNFNNMKSLMERNIRPKEPKPVKKTDITSFEDILKNTRLETKKVDNDLKIMKKNEKYAKIKLSRFDKENRYMN
jgi:hypothetical protein